jgi:phytoene dehydrogenase-like protein
MYDTIVIGSDVSSLIAAVSSARHGRKTVLLSEGNIPDTYSESGYTFNVDPMPLAGFGPDQICSRFLSENGIILADDINIHRLNPAFQIILPDHRIDFLNDINDLIGGLESEFPEAGMDIRRLYSSLMKMRNLMDTWLKENPRIHPASYKHFITLIRNVPEILKEKLSFLKMHRMLQKHPSLKKIFEAELNLLSNLHTNGNKPFSLMSPYILSLPHRGLYYLSGGRGSLMEALKRSFVTSGGVLIKNGFITGMAPSDEITVEINTCGQMSIIRGRNLIVSIQSEIFCLLLRNQKFRRLERRLKRVETRYYPLTLHMGVHDKGIPEKMAPYVVIIVEENRDMMDNNAVYVEMSEPGDLRRAPAGKRSLSATVFLRSSPVCLSSFELEETSKVIIKHLEMFLPFIRENLDYLNMEVSVELSEKCRGMVNQKYRIKRNPFFGITVLSNRTPLKNIHLTGGMLLAGLGFEGEILSGINAAFATIT